MQTSNRLAIAGHEQAINCYTQAISIEAIALLT